MGHFPQQSLVRPWAVNQKFTVLVASVEVNYVNTTQGPFPYRDWREHYQVKAEMKSMQNYGKWMIIHAWPFPTELR